uniref:Glycosyltransferase family 92 protein n=1 Tax=Parascaris univalens TaxID=6257 RepID=A0A915C9H7_PARUN
MNFAGYSQQDWLMKNYGIEKENKRTKTMDILLHIGHHHYGVPSAQIYRCINDYAEFPVTSRKMPIFSLINLFSPSN